MSDLAWGYCCPHCDKIGFSDGDEFFEHVSMCTDDGEDDVELNYVEPLDHMPQIPVGDHPGAFGYVRKNHIHEGVDLYAEDGDCVYAMCDGVVTAIIEDFTGPGCGMPWWNKTSALVVEDCEGVWIYGEITVSDRMHVGLEISAGCYIGDIAQVLKVDKGRPMSMLHLERYTKGTTASVGIWEKDTPKPVNLLDPTPLLLERLDVY